MKRLTSTVNAAAQTARRADLLAASASEVARSGGEAVTEVISRMGDINWSSRKITDIIAVINGVAFQTTILALNAAVEAARADEQGRGFAVVASEVRILAGRSSTTSEEITSLTEDSSRSVSSGSEMVAKAGDTMQIIVDRFSQVSKLIGEITASTVEQSQDLANMLDTVNSLDAMNQQNAALVEEAAAASISM